MTWIKKLYLYAVTLIGLVLIIIGATMLVSMGLKAALGVNDYITYPNQYNCPAAVPAKTPSTDAAAPVCNPDQMKQQDEFNKKNNANQKKRDIAQALAMIIVGTPVFMYHWKIARKET